MSDWSHDPYGGHGPRRFTGIPEHDHEDEGQELIPGPAITPYTASQVFAALKVLGYNASQADLAMTRAAARESWPLSRHVVRYDGEDGTYTVTPRRAS